MSVLKPKDEEKVGKIRERSKEAFAQEDRYWEEQRQAWFEQEAFYLGFQYIVHDGQRRWLTPPFSPSWRVRMVDNRIQPYITTALAKVLRHRPRWEVLPSTAEESDRRGAKLGEKLLSHWWRHLSLEDVYEKVALMALIYGTSFVKVTWNEMGLSKYQSKALGMAEKSTPGRPSKGKGEIEVEPVPPHEIWAPLGIEELEDSPWIVHGRYMTLEDIDARWPLDDRFEKKEIGPEDVKMPFLPSSPTDKSMSNSLLSSSDKTIVPDGAVVKEYWEKPCVEFPKGRYALIAADVVLVYQEKLPFGMVNYPVYKVVDLPVPRRLHGRSKVADLIPVQKDFNRTKSQVIEIKNLMSKPKWLVPRGAGLAKTALTDEPGEVVEFNALAGGPPIMVAPPPLPGYLIQLMQADEIAFREISGQHEVTQASVPAGVESGVAIQFLQEQDDTRLAPFIRRLDRMFARVGKEMLLLAKKFYKSDRVIKIVGKDRQIEVLKFDQAELGDNTDVNVIMTAGLPEGKVAKQEAVLRLWDRGLLGPKELPDTAKQALKFMEVGVEEEVFRENLADINKAKRETEDMLNGGSVVVHPFEDHLAHVKEHMLPIKSGEVIDSDIMEVLTAHILTHLGMAQGQAPSPEPGAAPPPGPAAPGGPGLEAGLGEEEFIGPPEGGPL